MLPPKLKRSVAVGLLLVGAAVADAQPAGPEITPDHYRRPSWGVGTGSWSVTEGSPPSGEPQAPCPTRRGSLWRRCKHCLVDQFLGYPSEFEAPPLGLAVSQHVHAQVANGVAARMVLHDYDFVPCSDRLNPRGKGRLGHLAGLLSHHPFPLVIEGDPRAPHLAEARRLEVLRELAACSLPVPPERVVVGGPLSRPGSGEEALLIHQTRILQTRTAGAQPGTGAGPFGGNVGFGGFGVGSGFGPTPGFGGTSGFGPTSGFGAGVSGGATSGTGGIR